MPPACAVPLETAIAVMKQFIDRFRTNDLPPWSDAVWQQMSKALKDLGFHWTPNCFHTNVIYNRRNLLSQARKEMGIMLSPPDMNNNVHTESRLSASETNDDNSENSRLNLADFNDESIKTMLLTEEEWNNIKPADTGENIKMKPGVWANVVADAFWLQFRMPCAFVFKWGRIRYSSEEKAYFIKFHGVCKSNICKNVIDGTGEKKDNEKGVTFAIRTRDTRHENHEIVKRPFNGEKRKNAYTELKTDGGAKYRKRRAQELMLAGDIEPPVVPSLDVLRQAKKRNIDENLGIKKNDGRDIVRAIEEMSSDPQYRRVIQEVGGFPFRVLYGSGAQYRVYQEYRRLMKNRATICIDATGSLVTKLQRKNDTKSGHIFLYAIVINFSGTTACVYQMLSERHDSVTIMMWLLRWVQNGAQMPKEAVCDYSRALLMGLSMAFNKRPIKEYISERFRALMDPRQEIATEPTTFIRIDVAHFTHMVCRWQCFKNTRQNAIKEFFLRCVTLMVESKTLVQFQRIFVLTCAVALHTHEDSVVDTKEAYTPTNARKELEHCISSGNVIESFLHYEDTKTRNAPFCQQFSEVDVGDDTEPKDNISSSSPTCIGQWIDDLIMNVKRVRKIGKNLNPFYLPDFIDQFTGVAKEFVLWSSVGMAPNTQRATSSYIEGYFNDLKNRTLKDYKLPISVNKFIREHIKDSEQTSCIVSGHIIHHNNQRLHNNKFELAQVKESEQKNTEEVSDNANEIDSDLVEVENWGGKADAQQHINYHPQESSNACATADSDFVDVLTPINEVSPSVTYEIKTVHEVKNLCTDEDNFHPFTNEDSDHAHLEEASRDENLDLIESADFGALSYSIFKSKLEQSQSVSSPITKRTQQIKNRPVASAGKYYKPYPDISQDNNFVASKENCYRKKVTLLPNGSCSPAINLEGHFHFIRNTCAFDSIVQILATAGTDNKEYRIFLENSSNETLKFILNFMKNGVSKNILTERARILSAFHIPTVQAKIGDKAIAYKVDAESNVSDTVRNTMASSPSKIDIHTCSCCGTNNISHYTIAPNHRTLFKKSLSALQEALEFHSPIFNIKCRNECPGRLTRTSHLTEHIFIEMDIRDEKNLEKALRCSLQEFPTQLHLGPGNQSPTSEYRLAGVVEYVPGHYIAHSFRNGGIWDKFNDLDKKKRVSRPGTIIEPHLAIYIKKN